MKMFEDKYIVLTGGAGFIGSGVLRCLNDRGFFNVIVVDDLGRSDKWKNLVGKRFTDILYKHHLFDWLQGKETEIQAIIHLGACTSTTETDASYLLENNYRYTLRLAEYALKNELRFIYASSAATYGDGSAGFSDDHDSLEALQPLNMYGYSKHLFDLWAKGQGVLDKVVGLKYFNVFGPNEYHKGRMASAIVKMAPSAMEEGVIRLFKFYDSHEPDHYADGDQCRDFIYVKDVARMTADFLQNDLGGIYNIGQGIPSTWNSLARAVFHALGLPEKIEYIDMPEDLKGKYQNYTCADMEKYEQNYPQHECVPLEAAVHEYIRHYLLQSKTW